MKPGARTTSVRRGLAARDRRVDVVAGPHGRNSGPNERSNSSSRVIEARAFLREQVDGGVERHELAQALAAAAARDARLLAVADHGRLDDLAAPAAIIAPIADASAQLPSG